MFRPARSFLAWLATPRALLPTFPFDWSCAPRSLLALFAGVLGGTHPALLCPRVTILPTGSIYGTCSLRACSEPVIRLYYAFAVPVLRLRYACAHLYLQVTLNGPADPACIQPLGSISLDSGTLNLVATQFSLDQEHNNRIVFSAADEASEAGSKAGTAGGAGSGEGGSAGIDPAVDVVLVSGDLRATIQVSACMGIALVPTQSRHAPWGKGCVHTGDVTGRLLRTSRQFLQASAPCTCSNHWITLIVRWH